MIGIIKCCLQLQCIRREDEHYLLFGPIGILMWLFDMIFVFRCCTKKRKRKISIQKGKYRTGIIGSGRINSI